MVKRAINLYLDIELIQLAQENFENLSGLVEQLLRDALLEKKPEAKEYFDILKAKEKATKELEKIKKQVKEKNKEKEEREWVDEKTLGRCE